MITEEQVIEMINKTLEMNLDLKTTPRDETLKTLGIDSLDFYNVLVELEDLTSKKVLDEDLEKMLTINAITKYFND
mgnify:FL=1